MSQTLLGFDFGTHRIGVAVGQTTTNSAEGIATIMANKFAGPWPQIQQLIDIWQPDGLVVGLPFVSNSEDSPLATKCREFGRELADRFSLPVNFIDETLTSAFADTLICETTTPGKAITKRRQTKRDRLAAELILQTYLHDHAPSQTG